MNLAGALQRQIARADVSNHRRVRARQQESQEAPLHALRTPLNAILAWTHVLGGRTHEADMRAGLEIIARNARRQADVLDRLSAGAPIDWQMRASDAHDVAPDLSGLRILLVDDDHAARVATREMVADAGAVVIDVSSAAEAMDLIDPERVDLIVSDIEMPRTDGYEFVREVRASSSSDVRRIPAIALTSLSSPGARRQAYAAGFQAHLTKPADVVELCLVIASLARLGHPAAS